MRSSKFGASIRRLHDKAIKSKKDLYECPKCSKVKVTRTSNAVWTCKSCGAVFAGGAYSFSTEAGVISSRLVGEYSRQAA